MRKAEVILEYQNYIESPPVPPKQLYARACSSDSVTIESWRDTWIKNLKQNKENLGSFKDHSVGELFGLNQNKPCFVIGSGPSLAYNAHLLANKRDILAVSCLHNYHFFEDRGIPIDYYVSLDAGPVTIEEVSEGGQKSEQEYWDSTRDKTLIAFIASDPQLLKKWQGKLYLFTAPVPDDAYMKALESIEPFHVYVSNGGNVLGACLYIAKGIFGSNPIAYLGADFCFSYDKKFHGWASKYDASLGQVLRAVDVYGNKVLTWASYFNFKNWFDYIVETVPGIYINCTEGGTMGAYPDGNLMKLRQMALEDFLGMYQMNDHLREACAHPEVNAKKLLF